MPRGAGAEGAERPGGRGIAHAPNKYLPPVALTLPVGSIDLDAGLLPVSPAKSRCERILPLHPTTTAALTSYAALRSRKHPHARTFFVSIRGTALGHGPVMEAFRQACTAAGLDTPGARDRIHNLRHYADGWVMRPAVTFALAAAAEPVLPSA
jgi:site-specific recombinase XerC